MEVDELIFFKGQSRPSDSESKNDEYLSTTTYLIASGPIEVKAKAKKIQRIVWTPMS